MKRLLIASIGITEGDMSLKTIEKIKKTELILNYAAENSYLEKIFSNKKIINLNQRLSKIKSDENKLNYIYNIVNKLLNSYSNLSLLVQGNPLFFNILTQELIILFKKKIYLEIIPSISSIDYVISTIINKINQKLKMYLILSTPNYLISTSALDLFNKDTIIMNFHSIKNKNFSSENKKIIEIISKMKKRHIYSIKIDTKKSREIINKYLIPKELKKLIKETDNETTIYMPAINTKNTWR